MMDSVGEFFKAKRMSKGLSMSEASIALGFKSEASVWHFECGKAKNFEEYYPALCKLYDVPPRELISLVLKLTMFKLEKNLEVSKVEDYL
jgi:transcriptional regulator with XRE-family HTH domain